MKLRYIILGFSLLLFAENSFGQTNQTGRLFIPFFNKESQSNVVVTVCNFNGGEPCPLKYTNVLSNTNLFTPEEQKLLEGIFEKYRNYREFTTNSGPSGTELKSLSKTNIVTPYFHITNEVFVAHFQYTNLDAKEDMEFGGQSISTKFLTDTGDGYVVGIGPEGDRVRFQFMQFKQGEPNGLYAVFVNSHLESYHHSFNRMAIGKYFMWKPSSGRLLIEAEFKEPYDLKKNTLQPQWR